MKHWKIIWHIIHRFTPVQIKKNQHIQNQRLKKNLIRYLYVYVFLLNLDSIQQ